MTSTNGKATRLKVDAVEAAKLHLYTARWINDAYVADCPVRLEYASEVNPETHNVVIAFNRRGVVVPGSIEQGRKIRLATDEDVEAEQGQAERSRLVDHLIAFANVISAHPELPIRSGLGATVNLHTRLSKDELIAVGKDLGIEPKRAYGTRFEVTWVAPGGVEHRDLSVSWAATYPGCPFALVPGEGESEGTWVEAPEGVDGVVPEGANGGVVPCKWDAGHDEAHYAPVKR